jgi:hypothetical protein
VSSAYDERGRGGPEEVHTSDEGAPNAGDGAATEDFQATTCARRWRGVGCVWVRKKGEAGVLA